MTGLRLEHFPDVLETLDTRAHRLEDVLSIKAGASTKLAWRCSAGPDHEWETTVKARCALVTRCPMCSGNRVSVTNSLEALFPHLAEELVPELNNGDAGHTVTAQANKTLWWRCPAKGHVYDLRVANRTSQGQNCPYCAGKRVYPGESLADLHPELAAEFHPTKNGAKTSLDYVPGSNKKVHWQCRKSPVLHVWKTMILHRTLANSGCPYCAGQKVCADNSLSFLRPDLAAEFDAAATGFTADDVTAKSSKEVAWACSAHPEHRWRAVVYNRSRPNEPEGCPFCSGRRPWSGNNLELHFPDIAAELDPDLNDGKRATGFLPFSAEKVTWRCRRNSEHTWKQQISSRTNQGAGCRQCDSGRRYSRIELQVAHLLAKVLPVALDMRYVDLSTRERLAEVDIPIPSHKVLVEYDGGFHHQNRGNRDRTGRDERKNADFEAAGWRVLRAREAPLEKIRDWDILISGKTKDAAVDVARRLLEVLVGEWGLPGQLTLTDDQVATALREADERIERMRQDKADRDAAKVHLAAVQQDRRGAKAT